MMDNFRFLMNPFYHIVIIVVPVLLKLLGVIKSDWLIVLIPLFVVVAFWVIAAFIYARMMKDP